MRHKTVGQALAERAGETGAGNPGEIAEVGGGMVPREVIVPVPGLAQVTGDATARNRPWPEGEPEPKARRYRVLKGGSYLDPVSRQRCQLKPGKELPAGEYNIIEVQKQGITVERIDEDAPKETPSYVV